MFSGGRRLNRRRVAVACNPRTRVATLRARAFREHGIHIVRELPSGLPLIYADPLLLQQALLDIIVNAEQAMSEGGRLELRVSATAEGGVLGPPSRIPDPEFQTRTCPMSSSRSSRPSALVTAPVSAWRSPMGLSRTTVAP